MRLKTRSVCWLVCWVRLLSGLVGVLTFGFVTLDLLELWVDHWFLAELGKEANQRRDKDNDC